MLHIPEMCAIPNFQRIILPVRVSETSLFLNVLRSRYCGRALIHLSDMGAYIIEVAFITAFGAYLSLDLTRHHPLLRSTAQKQASCLSQRPRRRILCNRQRFHQIGVSRSASFIISLGTAVADVPFSANSRTPSKLSMKRSPLRHR